ncbi:hypothetical protein CONLIGDRAFT_103873 [Coniochaeta ligniaria NRRL 30616]|uniref:C2H2-type domain-containing protein n=1 Tax=Coniochaeta ligniaria NRRL 30616 TaxID=1408157 RepID=A0A1J7JAX5_9PEZI|nr:hypothetical protein CONLIGDRAFT_103873 [Coniochaeta ligniaria NRRL 30616]
MMSDPPGEAISSRRKAVCPYLSWNEQTGFDRSSCTVVMAFDPESLSLFDLSDSSLFLFPSLSPRGCSDSPETTDNTTSAETLLSDDVDRVNSKVPSGGGTLDIYPTSCTSEASDENMPASRFCSLLGAIDSYQSKWLRPSSHASFHKVDLICEVCGRRCRDTKALQQHKRCHLKPYQCSNPKCYLRFSTRRDLNRHRFTVHSVQGTATLASCPHCLKRFSRHDNLKRHVIGHRKPQPE